MENLLVKDSATVLYEGRFLRLRQHNGWEYVERIKGSGIVAILAITEADKMVLVEQYRPAFGMQTIELPSGLSGDMEGVADETLSEAAKRELFEETGYQAEAMEYLVEGPVSAGLSTEVVTFFRARRLNKAGKGGGDASEKIVIHEVDRQSLGSWLQDKRAENRLVDYRIYTALYLAA